MEDSSKKTAKTQSDWYSYTTVFDFQESEILRCSNLKSHEHRYSDKNMASVREMAQSSTDEMSQSQRNVPGVPGTDSYPESFSNKNRGTGRGGAANKKRNMGRSEWRYSILEFPPQLFLYFGLTAKAKRK